MLLPRGVYRANWLLAGNPVLVAIDQAHNIIDWETVRAGDDPCVILDRLWAVLEVQDSVEPPTPKLLDRAVRLTAS